MSETITNFESELLHKIQFKSSSKVSMDAFLFKSFKFFDLYNNGWLNRQDFFKAIAKCGVVVETHDMDTIFNHYKTEEDKVSYKQFIQNLLFREDEIETSSAKLKQSNFSQPVNQSNIDREQKPASSRRQDQLDKSQRYSQKQKLKESKIDQIYTRCETFQEIMDCILKTLRKQGTGSLIELAVQLKSQDPKKIHLIPRSSLRPFFPYLTDANISTLLSQFPSKTPETINYAELIYSLKGDLDNECLKCIEELFEEMDFKKQREVSLEYILGKWKSRDGKQDFKKWISLYCQFQGIDDGVFTDEDFIDFFGFLSFSFHSFEAFHHFINKSFHEDDNRSVHSTRSKRQFPSKQADRTPPPEEQDFRKNKNGPKSQHSQQQQQQKFPQHEHEHDHDHDQRKSVSRYDDLQKKETNGNFVRQVESIIVRMKKRLASKGTKGFLLFEKAMINADADRDTLLSFDEFKQVIKDQRIDITPTECNIVFDVFDEQGTGYVNLGEFMYTLRGKMPQNRKQLVERLWSQVSGQAQHTNFSQIKHSLNFKGHPDIQNSRKFEDEIFKQIQQTILTIQDLNHTPRSDNISRAEFIEYMDNLSLSVLDDKLFQSVLLNFWKVNTSTNITEKYAGSRKLFDPSKNGYLMDHHRYVVKGGSVSMNAPFGTSLEPTSYFTEHRKL